MFIVYKIGEGPGEFNQSLTDALIVCLALWG